MANVQTDFSLSFFLFFSLQETNEIVAIKKFKDSEGETWFFSGLCRILCHVKYNSE